MYVPLSFSLQPPNPSPLINFPSLILIIPGAVDVVSFSSLLLFHFFAVSAIENCAIRLKISTMILCTGRAFLFRMQRNRALFRYLEQGDRVKFDLEPTGLQ